MSTDELKQQIEEEIAKAGEIFRSIDANEDSRIALSELKVRLKARQDEIADTPVGEFYTDLFGHFDAADKNDDDLVSFVEFMLFFDKAKEKYMG